MTRLSPQSPGAAGQIWIPCLDLVDLWFLPGLPQLFPSPDRGCGLNFAASEVRWPGSPAEGARRRVTRAQEDGGRADPGVQPAGPQDARRVTCLWGLRRGLLSPLGFHGWQPAPLAPLYRWGARGLPGGTVSGLRKLGCLPRATPRNAEAPPGNANPGPVRETAGHLCPVKT